MSEILTEEEINLIESDFLKNTKELTATEYRRIRKNVGPFMIMNVVRKYKGYLLIFEKDKYLDDKLYYFTYPYIISGYSYIECAKGNNGYIYLFNKDKKKED